MVVRVISIVILFVSSVSLLGQGSSWLKENQDENDLTYTHCVNVDASYFFLSNQEDRELFEGKFQNSILEINELGDTIQNKNVSLGEFHYEELFSISYLELTDLFLITGLAIQDSIFSSNSYWLSIVLDRNLDFVSFDTISFGRPVEFETLSSNTTNDNGVFQNLAIYNKINSNDYLKQSTYFVKYNSEGNVEMYRDFQEEIEFYYSAEIADENKFVAISDSTIILDSNFEIEDKFISTFGNASVSGQRLIKVDSFYYLSIKSNFAEVGGDFTQVLLKMNTDFEIVSYNDFFQHDGDIGFRTECLDYRNGNLFSGVMDFPFTINGSWYNFFKVMKTNLDLDDSWSLYYSGGQSYYCNGLIATEDGGVIVYGHHEDLFNVKNFPFIIKFKADGTTSTEFEENPSFLVRVLNNPSFDKFEIVIDGYTLSNANLLLSDMSGTIVLSEYITSSSISTDVSHLASGTYIFSLIKDGKVLLSDKWMKL